MGLSRRQFTREFKLAALQRLEVGASVAEVARASEVNPNMLRRWRHEFRQGPGNAFPGLGQRRWEQGRVAQLERKIGQQTLEIDFLKGCLQPIEEQRQRSRSLDGETYGRVGRRKPGGLLSLPAGTSRAGPRFRTARRHPAPGIGVSQLRVAAHDP